ncbi:MAG: hypothetical protein GF383_08460, partial [Candidatus Lokiarchaeota archaeon]|nr:hypothetical protein [Candidatus Lokiarchaeota archaeon]MBD3340391.1 hypothetical protein [Candidatus Lokiarchaeota archaeon]
MLIGVMTDRNILFLIPEFPNIGEYQKSLYHNDIPLGTIQIASYLKENADVKCDVIDLRMENDQKSHSYLASLDSEKFRIPFVKLLEKNVIQEYQNISINCYTSFQYLMTELMAKIVREEFPEKNIIVGGYHPSGVPADFTYKNSPYDIIVRGEAEKVLLDLFTSKKLDSKINFKNPQVMLADKVIDINDLPFPDFELYLR